MRATLTPLFCATSLLWPHAACTDDDDDDGGDEAADTEDGTGSPTGGGGSTLSSTMSADTSGAGTTEGDPSTDGTAADGTSMDSGGGGDPSIALCIAWCFHQADCRAIEVTMFDCEVVCGPSYEATPVDCHDEVDAIFTCAAALDCAEEADFNVNDASGPCGDAIEAYQACLGA